MHRYPARRYLLLILYIVLAVLCAACASGSAGSTQKVDRALVRLGELEEKVDELEKAISTSGPRVSAAKERLHWSYTDPLTKPDKWGSLDPSYSLSADGSAQSPINLDKAKVVQIADLKFDYAATAASVINDGHTIQVDIKTDKSPTLTIDGIKFKLSEFHFHGPSEHTVNGKSYPLEVHFVHKADDGPLAVFGAFVEEGAENKAMGQVIEMLPKEANLAVLIPQPLDLSGLLPKLDATFRYTGSLTTPPCSEGVKWNLALKPLTMSKAQIAAITSKFAEKNNRPIQPIKTRELVFDTLDG